VAEAGSESICGLEEGGATCVRAGTGVGGGGATCVRAGGRLLRVFPREVGLALGDKREKRFFVNEHGDVREISAFGLADLEGNIKGDASSGEDEKEPDDWESPENLSFSLAEKVFSWLSCSFCCRRAAIA
jgi:hypothetical protein